MGLVSRVADDDESVVPLAVQIATGIGGDSPFGVWMTKDVLWANLEASSMTAAIELENRTQILATTTKDHREAVSVFLEKRQSDYRGW